MALLSGIKFRFVDSYVEELFVKDPHPVPDLAVNADAVENKIPKIPHIKNHTHALHPLPWDVNYTYLFLTFSVVSQNREKLSLVLLTEELGSVDHVGQSALDLVPFPGLQAAV